MKHHSLSNYYLSKIKAICLITFVLSLSGCAFVERVAEPIENPIIWDVETAIAMCLQEVTGRSVTALDKIDYDTHCKLEDCVNEKTDSKERLVLEYHGSKDGLIPRAK